jgi:hypothetical protein
MAEDEHLIWLFRQDKGTVAEFRIRTADEPPEDAVTIVSVRLRGADSQLVEDVGNAAQRWLERRLKASFVTFERRHIAADPGGKPS